MPKFRLIAAAAALFAFMPAAQAASVEDLYRTDVAMRYCGVTSSRLERLDLRAEIEQAIVDGNLKTDEVEQVYDVLVAAARADTDLFCNDSWVLANSVLDSL